MSRPKVQAPSAPEPVTYDEPAVETPPLAGFVRLVHPTTGATADVGDNPETVALHRARGWRPIDEPDTDPEPISDEAPASDNSTEDTPS